jgi:hypothetical protein
MQELNYKTSDSINQSSSHATTNEVATMQWQKSKNTTKFTITNILKRKNKIAKTILVNGPR